MRPICIVFLALLAISILMLYASALVAIGSHPGNALADELFLGSLATLGLAGATVLWGLLAVKVLESR